MPAKTAPTLKDTDTIEIVGKKGVMPYSKVKDAVIFLGDQWFWKDDNENLVKIADPSGKKRLFRKTSKLIVEIRKGVFVHKNSVIKTPDGILLDKDDPDTVVVDGKVTRRAYTIDIDGELYLKSDPKIKYCKVSELPIIVGKNTIKLDPPYYKEDYYIHKKYGTSLVKTADGHTVMKNDSRLVLSKDGSEVYYHRLMADKKQQIPVFWKFRDSTNPQMDRIDYINMFVEDIEVAREFVEMGVRVHKNQYAELKKIYEGVIVIQQAAATKQLKAALKYMDDGPDENMAKVVKKIPGPWPGKHAVFNPSKWAPIISKTTKLTGGLKYTFGLEVETSQGLLPNALAEQLPIKIVGDRSIGAGEYVSPVLHGDAGIQYVQQVCEMLAAHTLVDDRCGIHVHIGGMDNTKGVAEGDFDRHFAVNAIKLGCQIEEALYKSCPESRKPTLKHCHSIQRWSDINEKNWREYLGSYVFGPEESWKTPWSFEAYRYGEEGFRRTNKVDTWCGGRYKWLNLVHVLTKSSFNTCELRLFPGSTNFEKIYCYIMTSMAFVWFVENKANRIVKGDVTLEEVLTTPFTKAPEIGEKLVKFYKARTKKFNRGDMYPKLIPPSFM